MTFAETQLKHESGKSWGRGLVKANISASGV